MSSEVLNDRRVKAAIASKGTSSSAILDLACKLCVENGIGGDVLDFGAGQGDLLHRLNDVGGFRSLCGSDIIDRPSSLPNNVSWQQIDLNETLIRPGGFDLVVSTEVIEHLENPRAMFRNIFELLRPGGKMIVTTPNQNSVRSLLALILKGNFVSFLDSSYPAHITPITNMDLVRAASEAGFYENSLYFSDSGGIPGKPNLTWQVVSLGFLRGRKFSDNVAIVGRKP